MRISSAFFKPGLPVKAISSFILSLDPEQNAARRLAAGSLSASELASFSAQAFIRELHNEAEAGWEMLLSAPLKRFH
eukprot:451601-Pyramimonas_sp.AAC.1